MDIEAKDEGTGGSHNSTVTASGSIENQDPNEFQLLSLPPEVVEMIFDYADSSSLLKLRLVSKATKAIVDQAKYIEKIPVLLRNGFVDTCNFFNEVICVSTTPIPWTNFAIDAHVLSTASIANFQKFTNQFAPIMKVCYLCGSGDEDRIRKFISHLTNPHTLEVASLGVTHQMSRHFSTYLNPSPERKTEEETTRRNLIGLKTLRIGEEFDEWSPNNQFLELLRGNCLPSNIRTLEIKQILIHPPALASSNLEAAPVVYHREEPDLNQALLVPLLTYLKSRASNSPSLAIHLNEIQRIEQTGEKRSLCRATFLEIVEECYPDKGKLDNVPCYFLPLAIPEPKYERKLKLDTTIVSLSGDLAGIRQRENIYVPPKFQVQVLIPAP